MTQITIAMPTKDSAAVLKRTLVAARQAAAAATGLHVGQLLIIDDESDDRTREIAREQATTAGWECTTIEEATTLPEARAMAIESVSTDWFLFLDDDVRLHGDYLEQMAAWLGNSRVGAIQGRKERRSEPDADWVRRRSRRGGTHATLIRTAAVRDVTIPGDIQVLEDEYLRQWVEDAGYRWVLEPDARFKHDCQDRHPIGWTEGVVGGRYGLSQFHDVALNVPFAAVTGRNPLPHLSRAAGWVYGRLNGTGDWRAIDQPSAAVTDGGRVEGDR